MKKYSCLIAAFALLIICFNTYSQSTTVQFSTTTSNGDESLKNVTLRVSLSAPSSSDVKVDYKVSGGTASGNGVDYILPSGTVTIKAGSTTGNINMTVINDCIAENDETVIVTLSNPVNATLGANTTETYTINDNDYSLTPSNDQTICKGESTTYSFTVKDGNGNVDTVYSYPTTPAYTGLYSYTFKFSWYSSNDSVTCELMDTTHINVNPLPVANAGANQSICSGACTTLTASGGGSYSWSNGSVSSSINICPTVTTTYKLTVNLNGCTASDDVIVTVTSVPVVDAGPNQTICTGTCGDLTATGGDKNSTYTWSTGSNNTTIEVCPTVNSTYYVTLSNGSCSTKDSVIVTVASAPIASAGPDKTITVGQTTTLTASGGDSYKWSNGASTADNTVHPAISTIYCVTATKNGCSASDCAAVLVNACVPPALTVTPDSVGICLGESTTITANGSGTFLWSNSATTSSITVSPTTRTTYIVTLTSGVCTNTNRAIVYVKQIPIANAGNDATICQGKSTTLTATGGGSYSWTPGALTTGSITVSPTTTTTYLLTVTNNGCSASDNVVVSVNTLPTVDAGANQTICNGSLATLTATAANSFKWSTNETTSSIKVSPTSTTTYSITTTDGNGCSASDFVIVTVNQNPSITVNSPAICKGVSATLTAAGGQTYVWEDASSLNPRTVSPTTTTSYYVTGTDVNGCSGTALSIVTINSDLKITVNNPTICFGASVDLTANGATTYSWSDNETTNPITVTPATTTTYIVTGNSNGCTGTAMATVTVNAFISVNAGIDRTICSGSNTTLTASGASTYSWSNTAKTNSTTVSPTTVSTYTVTGKDNSGCSATDDVVVFVNQLPVISVNDASTCKGVSATLTATGADSYFWNDASTANPKTVKPLTNTTYRVTGTDLNGCTGSAQAIVSINPDLNITVNSVTICSGNSATLTVNGANTYLWNNSSTSNSLVVNPVATTTYTVTGTDLNGCTGKATAVVTVNTTPVAAVRSSAVCNGDKAVLTATGGGTYLWDYNNSTSNTITVSPTQTTTYNVTVTKNSCTASADVIVTINSLPVITINNPSICKGSSATLTATGGTNYLWNTGALTASITVSPTVQTTYNITVTNAAGCTATSSTVVSVNSIPVVNAGADQTICDGGNVTLTAIGGDTYLWSNAGETMSSITVSPTSTTTYFVTATSNGCTASDAVVVFFGTTPLASAGQDQNICINASASLKATGGRTYLWSTGDYTQYINVSPAQTTTYTVTVADYSCTATASVVVSVNKFKTKKTQIIGLDSAYCRTNTDVAVTAVPDSGLFSGSLLQGNIFSPATFGPGTYNVTYTYNEGYKDTTILFMDDFSQDKGWSGYGQGGWERGPAQLSTGCEGSQDPASDTSPSADNSIVGTVIGGCYDNGLTQTYYLTSPSIDCSNASDVHVKFFADLGYEGNFWDNVSIDVYKAGTWYNIFKGDVNNYSDPDWKLRDYAVKSYADGNSDFRVRFGIGPTDASVAYKGWNIDDFEVYGIGNGTCQSVYTATTIVYDTIPLNAGADVQVCNGNSITLNATGASNYKWLPSTGLSADNIASPVANPVVTTNYTVTALNGKCSAVDYITVKVNNLPVANAGNDVKICKGSSATLSAIGGSQFIWNDGETSPSITVNPNINTLYMVTVTNRYGCTASDDVVVSINQLPVVSVSGDLTICKGERTMLTAADANQYSWSPSAGLSSSDIYSVYASPDSTTTYTVTGTDYNGCTGTAAVVVNIKPLPAAKAGNNISICKGDTAKLIASGGTQYMWAQDATMGSTIDNTTIVYPTSTTTYKVTVGNNGCYASDQVVVTVFSLPVANAGNDQSICFGQSANLRAKGGVGYFWSPATDLSNPFIDNPVANPTVTTNYILTVTDVNGCKATDNVTVTVNKASISTGADVSVCMGKSVQLNATGGVSYKWFPSNGLNNAFISDPVASPASTTTYYVVATDQFTCTGIDTIVVNVNTLPVADAGKDVSICFGSNIELKATGGVAYYWSTKESSDSINVAPLQNTAYIVTVYDIKGCYSTDAVNVTVNALPNADAGNNVTICSGDSIMLSAKGGQSYSWGPATGLSNNAISNPYAKPAATSTYILSVTDANGCQNTDEIIIKVNSLPLADAGNNLTICKGYPAALSGKGGVNYSWSPSTGLNYNYIADPLANPATTTTYKLTVTDINKCSDVTSVVVNVNNLPLADAGTDKTICLGDTVALNATGGVSYVWTPQGGLNNSIIANPIAYPLTTTTYNVQVTDSNGCVSVAKVKIIVNSLPPVSAGNNILLCRGKSIQLNATGGQSYSWSPSTGLSAVNISNPVANPTVTTTYTVKATNSFGCTANSDIIVDVPVLFADAGKDVTICHGDSINLYANNIASSYNWTTSAGQFIAKTATRYVKPNLTTTYILKITDSNGCIANDSMIVNVNPKPKANAGADLAICFGGKTAINAAGGVQYSWSPAEGLDNTKIQNPVASPTATTTYIVVVTDTNNCSATDNVVVKVNAVPLADAGNDVAICSGLTTKLTATGGSIYQWSPAAGLSNANISNPVANPTQTTTYYVTVTNASGCTSIDSLIVTVNNLPPAFAGNDTAVCYAQQFSLNATGGISYKWSPATGLSNANIANPSAKIIKPAVYTVTVTDANGCVNKDSVSISVRALPLAKAGSNITICIGKSDTLNATGGTKYIWSPSTGLDNASVNNPVANPLVTTTYIVTVTDSLGCSATDDIIVYVNNVQVTTTGDTSVCRGSAVNIWASGAAFYSWSPNSDLSNYTNSITLAKPEYTTTYTVLAIDKIGCTATGFVTVRVKDLPPVSAGSDVTLCNGSTVTLNASGAVTYNWYPTVGLDSAGKASPVVNVAYTTAYTVYGTDNNGCTGTAKVNVFVPENKPLKLTVSGITSVCDSNNINVVLTASFGFDQYNWSDGKSGIYNIVKKLGSYFVTGTDNYGCKKNSDTAHVTYRTDFEFKPKIMVDGPSEFCEGTASVRLFLADKYYSYEWATGSTTPYIVLGGNSEKRTPNGAYVVTVTDYCSRKYVSDTVYIKINPLPVASFYVDFSDTMMVKFHNTSFDGKYYMWDFNDGASEADSSMSPTHHFLFEGKHNIKLTVWNSCGVDTASHMIYVRYFNGIDDKTLSDNLSIFPVPATDNLNVKVNLSSRQDLKVTLLNELGEILYTANLKNVFGEANHNIDVRSFSKGMYVIRIESPNGTAYRKVMLQ